VVRGDLTTLTTRADNGDREAAWELARLLAKGDDLTTRADNGDHEAAEALADRGASARTDDGTP
jgi:hypothetical protein